MRLHLGLATLLTVVTVTAGAQGRLWEAKLAGDLRHVAALAEAGKPLSVSPRPMPFVRVGTDGRVRVVVRCTRWSGKMERSLVQGGLVIDHVSERWSTAVGSAAPESLRWLAAMPGVSVIHPPYGWVTSTGSVTSQADEVMRVAEARAALGVDGSGVAVGILSDSFSLTPEVGGTVSQDGILTGSNPQASGDLPPTVLLLDNGPVEDPRFEPTDEGAAMGELIHDLAPGSPLLFHTAVRSQVDFAEGIHELAAAGCDVIVDDVLWLAEPMFQDGPVAQAAEEAVEMGIPHVSAAGNQRDLGVLSTYLDIDPSADTEGEPNRDAPTGADFHDWGTDSGPFARIVTPNLASFVVVLQWAEPFAAPLGAGAEADLDLYLFNGASVSAEIVAQSTDVQGTLGAPAGDAVEILRFGRELEPERDYFLAANHVHGRRADLPFRVAIFITRLGLFNFPPEPDPEIFNQMQIYGHAAARGATAVAAVDFAESLTGGAAAGDPAVIDVQTFSALGGDLPFYFNGEGNPLPSAPALRFKPDVAATDGVNTTFFGFDTPNDPDSLPNFFGTSAAAGHVAAVAALVLDRAQQIGIFLTPQQVAAVFALRAQDIAEPGRDFRAGWGFVDAFELLSSVIPAATEGEILDFLLGITPRPADADLNDDGQVDSADLVRRIALPY